MSESTEWTGDNLNEILAWAAEAGCEIDTYEPQGNVLRVLGKQGGWVEIEPGDKIAVSATEPRTLVVLSVD